MTDIYPYEARESGRFEESVKEDGVCFGSVKGEWVPGSPGSDCSDCSLLSNSTACSYGYGFSLPNSPCGSTPSSPSPSKPLKSALRRPGEASCASSHGKVKLSVHWDPTTVFETRPWSGKRVRSSVTEDDDDDDAHHGDNHVAPPPAKRAKLVETHQVGSFTEHQRLTELQTQRQPIQLSSSVRMIPITGVPIFPEASRLVLPSFNFSCLDQSLNNTPTQTCSSSSSSSSTSGGSNLSRNLNAGGKFIPFSFATQKRKTPLHTMLPTASPVSIN